MTDAENPQEQPAQDSTPAEANVEQPASTESNAGESATFELDGQNVSLEELKAGYLRQADYTRKTQKLAEDQKRYEAMLQEFREQSSNTADASSVSDDSPQRTTDIPDDIIRKFMEREQRETVKERMTEWDSFKADSGLELTDEEEAAFMRSLAEREAAGKSVNISEMASLRFLSKIAEAKARKMLEQELARAKDQTKTVGPGKGGRIAPSKSGLQDLIDLAKQHGVE